METTDKNYTTPQPGNPWDKPEGRNNMSGRIFGGLIVVAVGVVLLAREMGADLPYWLLSWPMLLIVIGLYLGFRHSFRGPAWIILLLVGTVFMVDRIDPMLSFRDYLWPIIIIAVGLVIIFRPQKKRRERMWRQWENNNTSEQLNASDELLDSVTIFGGVKKNIISKTFRGGEITTIFGGTDLNLTQADIQGKVVLEMTQIFGGTKLIVPPHWKIQSDELVSIFGGLDDKRLIQPNMTLDPDKTLVLRGTCLFGGIDIKSF